MQLRQCYATCLLLLLLLLFLLVLLFPLSCCCSCCFRCCLLLVGQRTCSAKLASHSRSSLWKVMSALSATIQLGLLTRFASLYIT
jgi:hypothetical protein